MIGILPESLEIDNVEYKIHSDYRVALFIFKAYRDDELSDYEKSMVCLECLFQEMPKDLNKALEKAVWFLDGGDMPKSKQASSPMMDWEQDQYIIFPALNKVAGYEIRSVKYLHWWSFLGLFHGIDEGLYSQVMNIRAKKIKGKKLEKWERDFYIEHRELIDIRHELTAEEQAELDFINNLV